MTDTSDRPSGTPATLPHLASLTAAVAVEIARQSTMAFDAGLYLVSTPIGNLGDISVRALAVLAGADMICCEDTRHSRVLFQHYGIDVPLRPYHEHNAQVERPRILSALARGKIIALVTDAGTPLVSDPGLKLVQAALEAGHKVTAVPGASAVLCGLAMAGLPTDTFLFAGFLPPKSGPRRSRLMELASVPATLVFFEAPTRVARTLLDMRDLLGDRLLVVARELTKRFEEIRRGPLAALAEDFAGESLKGEIVLLLGPPAVVETSDERILSALGRALESLSLRDAAKSVADKLGAPKSRVYDLGVRLKAQTDAS